MKQSNHRRAAAKPAGLYLIELRSRLARLRRPAFKPLFSRVAAVGLEVLPPSALTTSPTVLSMPGSETDPEPKPL